MIKREGLSAERRGPYGRKHCTIDDSSSGMLPHACNRNLDVWWEGGVSARRLQHHEPRGKGKVGRKKGCFVSAGSVSSVLSILPIGMEAVDSGRTAIWTGVWNRLDCICPADCMDDCLHKHKETLGKNNGGTDVNSFASIGTG